MPGYAYPKTLDEALDHLASGTWTVIAGGTDFYPARTDTVIDQNVLDITGMDTPRGISKNGRYWRIDGLTPWSDIVAADLPPAFDGLKRAGEQLGSVQIQNTATLAGNLCNASPAADGVPPLLTLDAEIELASIGGTRVVPLAKFITGNRRTVREPGELLTAVLIPAEATGGTGRFIKLGVREYLVIAMVSVAARLKIGADGRIEDVRIAVGACSEVPCRLPDLEQFLVGQRVEDALAHGIGREFLEGLTPIDDVRATAAYRLDAVAELITRAIGQCVASEP